MKKFTFDEIKELIEIQIEEDCMNFSEIEIEAVKESYQELLNKLSPGLKENERFQG